MNAPMEANIFSIHIDSIKGDEPWDTRIMWQEEMQAIKRKLR